MDKKVWDRSPGRRHLETAIGRQSTACKHWASASPGRSSRHCLRGSFVLSRTGNNKKPSSKSPSQRCLLPACSSSGTASGRCVGNEASGGKRQARRQCLSGRNSMGRKSGVAWTRALNGTRMTGTLPPHDTDLVSRAEECPVLVPTTSMKASGKPFRRSAHVRI